MPLPHRTPTGHRAGCRTHRSGKSVAAAELRADKITALAEGFAQRGYLDLQILLGDNDAWPDSAQQLFLCYQRTIRFEQDDEQIESARPQLDRDGIEKQPSLAQQYPKASEFERRGGPNRTRTRHGHQRIIAPDRLLSFLRLD